MERYSYSDESSSKRIVNSKLGRGITAVAILGSLAGGTAKAVYDHDHQPHDLPNQGNHLVLSPEETGAYFTKPSDLYTVATETPSQVTVTQPAQRQGIATLPPSEVGAYFSTDGSTDEQPATTTAPTEVSQQPAEVESTVTPEATDVPVTVVPSPTATTAPTQTPSPVATEQPTLASTQEPTDTPEPTQTPELTDVPTATATATPTKEAKPSPTPKPEKTVAPTPTAKPTEAPKPEATITADMSIPEQLKVVNPDYDKMNELAAVNTQLYGDAQPQYMCLQGVRLTIDQVYPDMDSALLIPSAYQAKAVFEAYPQRFAELKITDRKQLYELPPGAILVYQPNPEGGDNYDFAGGIHNGHIEIVISNDMNGTVIVGSDHQNSLDTDLIHMQGEVDVFIPTDGSDTQTANTGNSKHKTPVNAAGGEPAKSQIDQKPYPIPVNPSAKVYTHLKETSTGEGFLAPEQFNSPEAYQQAIKEQFGINMYGFDQQHLQWAWEEFWSLGKTEFLKSLNGVIIIADGHDGDGSEQVNCLFNNQPDVHTAQYSNEEFFKDIVTHELGHYYACRDYATGGNLLTVMAEVDKKEGPVSRYGRTDSHEDTADTVQQAANPGSDLDMITADYQKNNIADPSNPLPLHKKIANAILWTPVKEHRDWNKVING